MIRTVGLKVKLQFAFVLIGFLAVSMTGWQAFENARNTIEDITVDRLTSIRETKKRQIETYFQQIQNQVLTIAENRMVRDATKQFIQSFRNISTTTHSDTLGRIIRNAILSNRDLHQSGVVSKYIQIRNTYSSNFENMVRRFDYADIDLVDAETGTIVFSTVMKNDFGINILESSYSKTKLSELFKDVRSGTRSNYCRLIDFEPSVASANIPASFVAAPIIDNNKTIGVVIVQISVTHINNVMTSNNNWRAEGLGGTGETYIVGSDYTMRTDSRFFIQEPDEYFRRLSKIGTDANLISNIRSRATSILLQKVRTTATQEALSGKTDTKIINDYRGISVLSSFTPLQIPGVQWVILAEIDASEAFRSVYELRERLILFGLVILLAAAGLGVVISRTIANPIRQLTDATDKFGKGLLSHRAIVETKDEIGQLAIAFNTMAERRTHDIEQLKNEIEERQRVEKRLRVSRERLRNLSAHLQSVREEERKGIAREIHDELGQALTTLKLNLSLLKDNITANDTEATGQIEKMVHLIDSTIRSVKRMITNLRPRLLDDLGLTAAIEWQADEFKQQTGISYKILIDPNEIVTDQDRSTAIFRIFQETLTNIARHANANAVDISLTELEGNIELCVTDNGIGITQDRINDPKSFGLLGIRERAYYWGGSANISPSPTGGTTVLVRIPTTEKDSL
jgi:signal transduction histidine kinase